MAETVLHLKGKKDGIDMAWVNFAMGHTVDALGYDQFYKDQEYTLNQFRIAEKHLNIISQHETVDIKKAVDESVRETVDQTMFPLFVQLTRERLPTGDIFFEDPKLAQDYNKQWSTRLEDISKISDFHSKMKAMNQLREDVEEEWEKIEATADREPTKREKESAKELFEIEKEWETFQEWKRGKNLKTKGKKS